jgi:hypothetical protein
MDNRYYNYGCPPLMNDGRFLSNYVRSSTFDQFIRNSNTIESGSSYRHFLQNNAMDIINNIKATQRQNNTCSVDGKCLPKTPAHNFSLPVSSTVVEWYEELLDDPEPEPAYVPELLNQLDNTSNHK